MRVLQVSVRAGGRAKKTFCFLPLLVLLLTSFCFAASSHSGPAFSPSQKTVDPGPGWHEQPFSRAAGEEDADLVIIINQQFYELLSPAIAGFGREQGLKILVKKGTCGLSAGALLAKTVEIASFCCPPGAVDRLPGLSFHTLGIYPISILVHKDNPVEDLSWRQTQQTFMGEIRNWSELGGPELPILPIVRLHCKNRPGHWRLMLDNADLFATYLREVGSIDDMYNLLRLHEEGIGYEVADGYHSRGTKPLRIDGRDSRDLEHLRSARYPFYRVLNMTTWDADRQAGGTTWQLFQKLAVFIEKYGLEKGVVPASQLRAAGWQFSGDELTGEPPGQQEPR